MKSISGKINNILKLLVLSCILTTPMFGLTLHNSTSDLTSIMGIKADLELKFAEACDVSTYYVEDQVAIAWRLAKLHINQTLSESGNRLLFNSDLALKFARFAYDTGEKEQVLVPNDEFGSAIAMLARWNYFFGSENKYKEIASLCMQYFELGLDPSHRYYKYMNDLYNIAKENLK